ncbi:MAG: hypothetical protein LBM66_04635 [Bifidobacteriaceae bacterium]|nr:hypothetical protein [Bifidobacteriaceae bacterium]
MSRYTIHATRSKSGKVWVLEGCGAVGQVKRLDQAPGLMREAVAYLKNAPIEDVEINLDIQLSEQDARVLADLEQAKAQAKAADREAAAAQRRAARRLHSDGLSLRDVGRIMGISGQRAGQLVNA